MPVQLMLVEDGGDTLLQAFDGRLGRKTEVEYCHQITRDDIGCTRAGVQVGDLEAGWREEIVAMVPVLCSQFGKCRNCKVNRVLRQMRVSHMALFAAHGEGGAQRATTPVLDHIAHQRGARRFADDAPVQTLLARCQTFDDSLGTVVRRAFFVTGDQECHRTLVIRVIGYKALGGHEHGCQAAFHVRCTASAEHAVLVDQRIERVVLPVLHRAGRDHVRMTCETQYRAVGSAVCGPEVIDVFDTHGLQLEAGIAQALHHHCLTVGIDRRH